MTLTTNYTPEELSKLAETVLLSGIAVSIADSGFISTPRANGMIPDFAAAAKQYPNNSVIQALFSEEAAKQAEQARSTIEMKPEEMKPEVAIDIAIAKINEAIAILDRRASPEEVHQYKEFIYAYADCVARETRAYKEFIYIYAERVTARNSLPYSGQPKRQATEVAALAKLKAALCLPER